MIMRISSVIKYVMVFVAVALGVPPLLYHFVIRGSPSISVDLFLIMLIVSELSGISVFFLLLRKLGITFGDLGYRRPTSVLPYVLALLIALAYAGVELQIPSVMEYSLKLTTTKLLAVIAAIVAGFSEETVFRGFIMNFTKEYGTLMSSLLSASLFGLSHLMWGLGGVLGTFLLGLGLAYVLSKGRSVVPCVVSHTIIDALIEPGLIITFFHL